MKTAYYKSNNYRKSERTRRFIIQRIIGIVMLLCSIALYMVCKDAPGPDDGGAILIPALLGFWMLFSRKVLIY